VNEASVYAALKQTFGYTEFRFHQKAVIARTLRSRNSLVIMPTGGYV
jgi:superfamily II DNA helicase RecQ